MPLAAKVVDFEFFFERAGINAWYPIDDVEAEVSRKQADGSFYKTDELGHHTQILSSCLVNGWKVCQHDV